MLVLSRKEGESILIGEGVEVAVVAIRGDKVRLGIEAPREMSIHREEVQQRIQAERESEA